MKEPIPYSPFTTRLSGGAKETELRIRSIVRWKKKRPPVPLLLLSAALVLSCFGLVSCRMEQSAGDKASAEIPSVRSVPSGGEAEKAEASGGQTAEPLTFQTLRRYDFYFSSGVGAWATELKIAADGSFSGVYRDSDMGAIGEGYPNGTLYYCAFSGQLAPLEQVNEYTYSTRIQSMETENEPDTQALRDGVRYLYSFPYGLDGAEELLIYLPDAPLEQLPAEYRSWVGYYSLPEDGRLPFYGLYNEAAQYGFSGYDLVESLQSSLNVTEESHQQLLAAAASLELTQIELNQNAREQYEMWDTLLNRQWAALKRLLEPEAMEMLTVEERAWIAEKETAVAAVGEEAGNGSLREAEMYSAAAEITRVRVYELQTVLEQQD